LPVLQLYRRKVSSSAAVTSVSPLSSKLIPVMCLLPFGVRCPKLLGVEGGVGSTEFLKTFAGFNLLWKPSVIGYPYHQTQSTITITGFPSKSVGVGPPLLVLGWGGITASEARCRSLKTPLSWNAMAEGDESAKLWKVNRTIHELVRDRVGFSTCLNQLEPHVMALRLISWQMKK
jgi:hypothetical protein